VRDSFLHSSSSKPSSEERLLARIRANFREALRPARWPMSSANGAPIHLLEAPRSPRSGQAQGMSFLTHAAVIAALAFLALRPGNPILTTDGATVFRDYPKYPHHFLERLANGTPSLDRGKGGGHDLLPARAGSPPPPSPIQLVRPSIPPERDYSLPVPPTILDRSAQSPPITVSRLGIPGGADNNSSGRGPENTIGERDGNTVGIGDRDGIGVSNDSRPYRVAATQPTCLYCPTPGYTEEARETKLQGMVTVLVLVGTDGHATNIRITKGLGAGLDERAVEAVRGWRFTPGRDAARHPVATWITIEVLFRLF